MSRKFLPLRWESTGDQWWFASPIDCAAANGHYNLVRELLHLDPNLLIKLTSLPRIRRLESVWDDEFSGVSKCRSTVARELLRDCENGAHNSLIRAGYGGWLLYSAAAAGDLEFVKELLERDSLLVFGEGEYGITDILYAAARGCAAEVFRLIFDSAVAEKGRRGEVSPVFKWEMMNRAVHAAARGGAAAVLEELLGDGEDVLGFRDSQGSTVLHAAAGRGQIQIVKNLISSYDIIDSEDDRGNTALNVAAYRGHLAVMKVLVSASPSSALGNNNCGDTFLHMAVAGFHMPSFRRVDRQMELMREIVGGNLVRIEEIVNVQNNDGRTALHMAVVENIQSDIVELLLLVRYIDVNLVDGEGNTPLDLLKQRPRSASSEILIRRLVSAGGVCRREDGAVRSAHVRMRGIGGSPGTSFRIPDAEIVLYTGFEHGARFSSELVSVDCGYLDENLSTPRPSSSKLKKSRSMTSATSRLKIMLRRGRQRSGGVSSPSIDSGCSTESHGIQRNTKNCPISLREQFATPSNKRIVSVQERVLSPSSKKKFGEGLPPNARQVLPKSNLGSPCSAMSHSSWSSPVDFGSAGPSSLNESPVKMKLKKRSSFNYFCFGGQGLAIEKSIKAQGRRMEKQPSLVDVV
ncbi:hypothetical protein SASPL_142596 [Salvia splendens]|uniref:Uncharacterized protein n=1 Tax=Salvia splendens TaxID=180675 RepID=A0A8X8Z975_SALSN|nr:uncharacterized protein LOC121771443 [Salvia splendens]KAG6396446.1 hypothetical protein SASPL_142596 [Salvia splendens]